jgi:hypothetical protein
MEKVFGIGLPKTGQTSLVAAMRILNYKTCSYPYDKSQIKESDFSLDLPVLVNYKKLDKKYPNSKFILTVRDYDSWLMSIRNHYRRYPASKRYLAQLYFRLKFWGTENFNERLMTEKYHKHSKDVLKYFADKKDQLLVINICGGEGWKKLCPFLGKKILRKTFPKANTGVYKKL